MSQERLKKRRMTAQEEQPRRIQVRDPVWRDADVFANWWVRRPDTHWHLLEICYELGVKIEPSEKLPTWDEYFGNYLRSDSSQQRSYFIALFEDRQEYGLGPIVCGGKFFYANCGSGWTSFLNPGFWERLNGKFQGKYVTALLGMPLREFYNLVTHLDPDLRSSGRPDLANEVTRSLEYLCRLLQIEQGVPATPVANA